MPVRSDKPPECPRCGYDLRGTAATWTEACPLEGVCSECGLEFEWSRIFVESEHPWLFEYHWRRRPIRCALMTLAHIMRPWLLWRRIDHSDRFHPGPAAVLALIVLVVWYVCWGLIAGVVTSFEVRLLQGGPRDFAALMAHFLNSRRYPHEAAFLLWSVLFWSMTVSASFLLLPISMRRAKVHPRHLMRLGLYSVPWITAISVTGFMMFGAAYIVILEAGGAWWRWQPLWEVMTLALSMVAIIVWYGLATGRYLRTERAWFVAVLLTILSGLFVAVIHVLMLVWATT